jgi:predicted ribosome quality control (RQC) complex YloA/Tae2 family protein
MPFDMLALAAMTDEINERIAGGQVQRILQPAESSIGFGIYASGQQRWLLLSADSRAARVSIASERLAKAFPTPSPFVMLLRKYLEGRRLLPAEQMPGERVLILSVSADDSVRLVAEIMGKHSNLILLDAADRILGALKTIPPRLSRVRPVLPGRPYRPPPARERDGSLFPPGPRIDPALEPAAARELLGGVPTETSVRAALLGLLPGASPFLAGQIALRAGADPDRKLHDSAVHTLVETASSLYRLLTNRRWEPHTFIDGRDRCDFAPYRPVGVENMAAVPTMSAAVERCLSGSERKDPLAGPRADLARELERARRAAERRVASMQAGLAAAAQADEARIRGQLILTYSHDVEPGADTLSLPDMGLEIPLDPALSPQANAERAFRRYAKLRDAAARLPALIADARAEAARLADLTVFVRLADSEGTLRDLQREITGPGRDRQTGRPAKRGPLRYRSGPFRALVGRNARENEEVTFRLAGRGDLWLHARERTGAHVILRDGASAPEDVVLAAAALAGFYSEGRADSRVPVDVTSPRAVRKMQGGPPGRVSYRDERTLSVEPSRAGWEIETG